MTVPQQSQVPVLNLKSFEDALDGLLLDANGMEIHTRSEVKLDAAEKELAALDDEKTQIRSQLAHLDDFEEKLKRIRKTYEVHEADNATARAATLATIDSLKKGGVTTQRKQGSDQ